MILCRLGRFQDNEWLIATPGAWYKAEYSKRRGVPSVT